MTRCIFFLIALICLTRETVALEPNEILKTPALEERARNISKNLRCLVCQNQSIDDSDAGLARDLRLLVRKRIIAGDSDEHVISHIVSRYGDFVLLRPPFNKWTLTLWLSPLILLFIGTLGLVFYFRRKVSLDISPPLSDPEKRILERIKEEKTL
jgi:cytochrome c-type biogenesis protein CcmH